jgi:hypothetical protein
VASLIITKEILALQAERAAREAEEKRKLLPPVDSPDDRADPDDAMPARVAAFWHHQEAAIPAWRLELREEREARQDAAKRGCWTG